MELKRVLGNSLFPGTVVVLLLLNAFFFFYQYTDGQGNIWEYGDTYSRELESLTDTNWEEGFAWCEAEEQAMLADSKETDSAIRYEVIRQIKSQYAYLLGYNTYLNKISTDAEKIRSVSLFNNPDSIAYRNVVKTAEDFHAMRDVSVSMGHDLAVTAFFADKWADYSILILVCVVCGLFLAERKESLSALIRTTTGGRWKLACKRIGILFVSAYIGTLIIVGSRVLLCGWMFHGLGEWNRILQSIPMFQNVCKPMTIGQFWIHYIAVKGLGAFWFGLVLWAILSAISNLNLAIAASGLLMGLEFTCTAIPFSSAFAVLRYVNIFSYVNYIQVFSQYLNIPVFGNLITGCDLALAILPFLCVVFSAVNVIICERRYPVSTFGRLPPRLDSAVKKMNLALPRCGEIEKLLVKRKGIFLLILLVILVFRMEAPPRGYVPYDPYVQFYQSEFAGPITEETIQRLECALHSGADAGNTMGLATVLQSAKDAPKGAWILPTAPYDAIWSNNVGNYQRRTALLSILFLVLTLAPIVSQERQDNMVTILNSTSGGRRKLWSKKQAAMLAVTVFVWLTVYGGEVIHTVDAYGAFQYLSAPACSIELFHDLAPAISLRGIIMIFYGAKLVILLIVGEISFLLSSMCSKNRNATLLCCVVLVIPAALAALGSKVGELTSFIVPLDGVEMLRLLIARK